MSTKKEKPSTQPTIPLPQYLQADSRSAQETQGQRCPRCWTARRAHSPATTAAARKPSNTAGCMAPLARICAEKRMAAGPVSDMRAEGEIKMLRESSRASRSPRCGAVGAGPALLKGKPGPQGREGRESKRRRPLAQRWRHEAAPEAEAQVGGNLRQSSLPGAPGLERGWE